MKYRMEKGIINGKNGLPLQPRFLCDNRLVCAATDYGIGEVEYYNAKSSGHRYAFRPGFWGGLRFYIEQNSLRYPLKIGTCTVEPWGYEGAWETGFGQYGISLSLFNDCFAVCLKNNKNAPDVKLILEFYEEYCFIPVPGLNPNLKSDKIRKWLPWEHTDGIFTGGYADDGTTHIAIGGTAVFNSKKRAKNTKYILSSANITAGAEYAFIFAFDGADAKTRLTESLSRYKTFISEQKRRYKHVSTNAPRLASPFPSLNNFFELAPMYHESLKVTDSPGALRAKTTHYWVWGWDSLTVGAAPVYWGDIEHTKKMLEFFKNISDGKGVPHALGRDMKNIDLCPAPAQGMFITVLYILHINGVDVSPYYGFAKDIFDMIIAAQSNDSGLMTGTSLMPDFRELIGETGNDISSFNNTVCYSALRAMEGLANALGDNETKKAAGEAAAKIRASFVKLLFDNKNNYIASSADAATYELRPIFGINAVKWENNFCKELLEGIEKSMLDFIEKHLLSPSGLRPIAVWCPEFDADANQLSCWWPVMCEFYAFLINKFDRIDLINGFIGWIRYWTDKLMCPEGITCYAENADVPLDNWNALNGTWQAYSMRGWYQAALHYIFGVEAVEGGLRLHPYSGVEMSIYGLHHAEQTLDIHMRGSGLKILSISIDGTEIQAGDFIPAAALRNAKELIVTRG